MDLHKVGLEVIGNGLKFIRSFAVRCDAAEKGYLRQVVPGNTKGMGALFGNSDSPAQFLLQQVDFIYDPSCRFEGVKRSRGGLTQEENEMNALQQLVRAYLREELNRVLNPICQRVLIQLLKRKERDGVRDHQPE